MAAAATWPDLTGTSRRDKPWLDGLSRLIFVSDMSDALSSVPFDFLEAEVVANVTSPEGSRHQWLWLTKRPERMAQFSDRLKAKSLSWPNNLWAGTSITSQGTTSRIKYVLRVGDENTIRFLSAAHSMRRSPSVICCPDSTGSSKAESLVGERLRFAWSGQSL